jgi:hypothetical protein
MSTEIFEHCYGFTVDNYCNALVSRGKYSQLVSKDGIKLVTFSYKILNTNDSVVLPHLENVLDLALRLHNGSLQGIKHSVVMQNFFSDKINAWFTSSNESFRAYQRFLAKQGTSSV